MHDVNLQLGRLVRGAALAAASLLPLATHSAVPGITSTSGTAGTFNLSAAAAYVSQPDGQAIYSWGYGCAAGSSPGFVPTAIAGAACGPMQLPGPTLVVTEGQTVTVTLTNNLPRAAGNTSILFPGFKVCPAVPNADGTCPAAATGVPGLLTQEAAPGGQVTYSFVADKPGTHSYYSGTQGDVQVEMGLYGALVVLPKTIPAACDGGSNAAKQAMETAQAAERGSGPPQDFRLAKAAFNHPLACYDREYLFQLSEMDPRIHAAVEQQKDLACTGCMVVQTEPYHATYFLLNGRSMPDDMDPNYAPQYPHQPYNSNPHMHPGEMTLVRMIGHGRLQHPFHEHANHLRVLARDGNLLTNANNSLAGPLLFTTTSTPGQTIDALFQWTGKGLNWDVYAHATGITTDACTPDANGYHSVPADNNFYEWCGDHTKPLESKPFGSVGSGGPVTLPDPNILANGPWYSGSPYFGPDANARSVGPTPIPPFGTIANDPGGEAGFAYMWHSHNEREITTNNIFPGGMMTMMLVDPWVFLINEAN